MAKPAQVSVLYPQKESSTFDMSYYLATHMPLVAKHWTKYGLKGYSIIQFGKDAPYSVQATLHWESLEAFQKAAAGAEAPEIMGDIAKFSNDQPVICAGEVVASG